MANRKKRTPKTTRDRRGRTRGSQTGGGTPPNGSSPESPEELIRKWFQQVRQGHREGADAFGLSLLNCVDGTAWMFELDEWEVVYPLPRLRLQGEAGRLIEPDGVFFCSMIPGDTHEQADERRELNRRMGNHEPDPTCYVNVEVKPDQQPWRDGDQLYETRKALRRKFGRLIRVKSVQLLVRAAAGGRDAFRLTDGNGQGQDLARVVRLAELDADQAPEAMSRTAFGAAVLLTMRNGGEPRHVEPVLERLFGGDWDWMSFGILNSILQIAPDLSTIVIPKLVKMQEDRTMANGTATGEMVPYREVFHRLVNDLVEGTKDPKQVPALRKLLDAREREQRKREREQRKHEREQRKHEREQRKHEREQRAERVAGLLGILAGRDMPLTKTQERRLRGLALNELPPLKLALRVKDAADFAKRAGLTNGGK